MLVLLACQAITPLDIAKKNLAQASIVIHKKGNWK